MNVNEVEDLTMFCRVCLQLPSEPELLDLNLIYDEEDQLTYHDCFTMCTQINICEGEGLPQNLCRSCGLELQMAYDFHKKVEESKRVLLQILDQQADAAITAVEEVVETERLIEDEEDDEGETGEEEHLDMEYQAIEHLEEEDAEAIQIKINTKFDGEEYIIEAITLADEDEIEEKANLPKEQITWEDAVVTVANEQHLPIKRETIKTEPEVEIGINDDCHLSSYEDEEMLDMEMADDPEAKTTSTSCVSDKTAKLLSVSEVQTKPTRSRYSGKFNCDLCQKTFPNHSRMMLHRRSHSLDRPKFPCPHCARVYATKQAMEVHIRTVHIKNGFVCPICSKLYVIKKSLEVHLRYHTGDFPYVCDLCGKKFAQIGHLNTHRNVKHNSVRFSCDFPNCGKFFTSSTSLRNHEFTHGEMPFQCSYCDKGYPSKSKLKVHIRRKHDMELTLDQLEPMRKFQTTRSKLSLVKVVKYLDYKTEVFIKEEATEEVKEEILVNMNDLTTTDYKDYVLSTNSDEAQLQSIDMKTEIVSKLSESENEVDEEFTFDDLYDKVFEDVKTEQSVQVDAGITVKTFPLKRRRRGRPPVKRVGSEDDPDLMLDEIEAALDKKSNEEIQKQNSRGANKKSILRIEEELGVESDSNLSAPSAKQRKPRTIRSANNDKDGPPFECEVCQLPCKSRSLLNSHRFRKHRPQEEPKFHCPDCNRGFANQESLKRHMRRPTCDAYPQFDCEHCGKKCVGLSNYKIHLRFHKRQYPFVCHLCGKKFMMCVHLNEHVLVKHENKRYPCEHPGCGKLFQTRNSLYNHAYQHKGFMPYECEYCKRGYASKSRLRFHCKKSHDIDHTIEELDRMQVTEKLPNPVVKPQ